MKNTKLKTKKVTLESMDLELRGLITNKVAGLNTKMENLGSQLGNRIDKIEINLTLTKRELEEKISKMLTRREFLSYMDPIAKAIQDWREEKAFGYEQYRRNSDKIEDHERRIQKLELKYCY